MLPHPLKRMWSLVSVSRNRGSLFLLNIFALLVAKFSLLLVLCLGFCLGNLRSLGFEEVRSLLQPLLSPVLASQRWPGSGKKADLGLALPASSEVCRQIAESREAAGSCSPTWIKWKETSSQWPCSQVKDLPFFPHSREGKKSSVWEIHVCEYMYGNLGYLTVGFSVLRVEWVW